MGIKGIDAGEHFIGALLTAQIRETQNTSNQISDLGWAAAQEWAQRFARLYDLVERDNDSVKVDRHLSGSFNYHRGSVESSIEHYEAMKMTRSAERLDAQP